MKYFSIIKSLLRISVFIGIIVLFSNVDCNPKPEPTPDKPYWGGNIQSHVKRMWGRYVVRMKPERKKGVDSGFFTYEDSSKGEIDIEFVDQNNDKKKFEVTFHHGEWILWDPERTIDLRDYPILNFNTDDDFHIYSFEWTDSYLAWFVDDCEIRRITAQENPEIKNNLINPQLIMMNIWTPISSLYSWTGEINDAELPVKIEIDWIKYYSWDLTTGFVAIPDFDDDFNYLDETKWDIFEQTFPNSNTDFKKSHVKINQDDGYLVLWLTKKGSLPPTQTNGLVAYYPFNGNANDESGNGNNGTINGSTLTTDRFNKTDKAFYFNGSNQNIYVASLNPIQNQLISSVTVSLWINSEGSTSAQQIFEAHTKPSSAREFYMEGNIPGKITFHIADENNNLHYCNISGILANQWIHLVGTYDGAIMKFYKNGSLIDNTLWTGQFKLLPQLIIGKDLDDNNQPFKGKIDDFRLYSRALTDEEILSLYHENGW